MYLGRESLAADGTLTLTVPDGARMARLSVRGGNFSYVEGGAAPTAGTWEGLVPGQVLELEGDDMTTFSAVRDSAGTGTMYVRYFDRESLRQNKKWQK